MCTESDVSFRALGISTFFTMEEEVLTETLEVVEVKEFEEMREKEEDEEDVDAWPKLRTLGGEGKNIPGYGLLYPFLMDVNQSMMPCLRKEGSKNPREWKIMLHHTNSEHWMLKM